jgi:hypothetical protein
MQVFVTSLSSGRTKKKKRKVEEKKEERRRKKKEKEVGMCYRQTIDGCIVKRVRE